MTHALIVLLVVLLAAAASGCRSTPSTARPVLIERTQSGYRMLRDGEPYTILGVGGQADLPLLKRYGGNTIRTWDAEGAGPLLDKAEELGIAVVLGIWLEHQRHGFDYDAPGARKQQLDRVERLVREHRDHPALLAWGVGNELELGGSFDAALEQINDASRLIQKLDPHHPAMAVIAEIGDDKAVRIQNECPDIDFLGVNAYGGMGSVAERLAEQGYTGPYAITEFGPIGFWETGRTRWGAPIEQTSSAKAEFIGSNYASTIAPNLGKQCLGSFAFLWGNKQETTGTWFGLLLESGETTETVDVLSEYWTGRPPANRAPRVTGLLLEDADAAQLAPGQTVMVRVEASDPDGDALGTEWRVLPESTVKSEGGDREERIDALPATIETVDATAARITLPDRAGNYRIFAVVRDGKGHAGTANLPIRIVQP